MRVLCGVAAAAALVGAARSFAVAPVAMTLARGPSGARGAGGASRLSGDATISVLKGAKIGVKGAKDQVGWIDDMVEVSRALLKERLIEKSIFHYDQRDSSLVESLMRELEPLRPWPSPAFDSRLKGTWCFVFTGAPTVGMSLITLLSRISVAVPPIDFLAAVLEVNDGAAQARVKVNILRLFDVELQVQTKLQAKADSVPASAHDTELVERFHGLRIQGVEIPTPASWHRCRKLEITYLDEDMLIARTANGPPHLLLRSTSPVLQRTSQATQYLTRALVDRQFSLSS